MSERVFLGAADPVRLDFLDAASAQRAELPNMRCENPIAVRGVEPLWMTSQAAQSRITGTELQCSTLSNNVSRFVR